MPTRNKDQNTLSLGDWNCLCDVCGFKFKASDLRQRWDGAMVCKEDWEPRHPMDYFRGYPDQQGVPWSRPDPAASGGTDVAGDTFPPTFDATAKALGNEPDTNADGYVDNGTNFYSDTGTITKFTA